MPVQGPQQPGFFLPQAEYFNLAPNTHVALQGRRRISTSSTATSIAPGGAVSPVTVAKQIEIGFGPGAGIYVHSADAIVNPADSGLELQVVGLRMGFTMSGGFGYDIGQPLLTLVTIAPPGAVALSDREKLITQTDIIAMDGVSPPQTFPLTFVAQITFKNNDPTNAHTVTVTTHIIYTRLDGIQE